MKENIKRQQEAGRERQQKERMEAIRERRKYELIQLALITRNPSLLEWKDN